MNSALPLGIAATALKKRLEPSANKFHAGAASDGKHYWLTPPDLYARLDAEFHFDFDPCPYPQPDRFDGLTCEWGWSNYVNPPFGAIMHEGKRKGMTAWVRKAIAEHAKGKRVVMVYPIDKWVLMLLKTILGEHAQVRNLGDVKWLATEDGSAHKGTGRHIACFILEPRRVAGDVVCPFCGEGDFDLVGLKMHLLNDEWCPQFGSAT